MRTFYRLALVAAVCCCVTAPVLAQSAAGAAARATSLSGFAGAAGNGDHQGWMFGGSAGWDFTPLVAIEATGAWVDRSTQADAFTGALKLRAAFRGRDKVAPFVTGGVGLYRASFTRGSTNMPEFYQQRFETRADGGRMNATFMDPSLVFGGGLNLFLSRAVAIRPSIEGLFVFRGSRHQLITTGGLNIAYYFEHRPVTPATGR